MANGGNRAIFATNTVTAIDGNVYIHIPFYAFAFANCNAFFAKTKGNLLTKGVVCVFCRGKIVWNGKASVLFVEVGADNIAPKVPLCKAGGNDGNVVFATLSAIDNQNVHKNLLQTYNVW